MLQTGNSVIVLCVTEVYILPVQHNFIQNLPNSDARSPCYVLKTHNNVTDTALQFDTDFELQILN